MSNYNLYTSKEKLDKYFEENIRQYCIDGVIMHSILKEHNFMVWYNAIRNKKYGYRNLQDFAKKNNLVFKIDRNYNNIDGRYNSKGKIDKFFEDRILLFCDDLDSISQKTIKDLGYIHWYNSVIGGKFGYKSLEDFLKKRGLSQKRLREKYTSKELIDQYFKIHIKHQCINGYMPSVDRLRKIKATCWYNSLLTGKHGYIGLVDFAKKNGYKVKYRLE